MSTVEEDDRVTIEIRFAVCGEFDEIKNSVEDIDTGALPAVLWTRTVFTADAGALMPTLQGLVAPDRTWNYVAWYSARHVAFALSLCQRSASGAVRIDCSYSVLATPSA